MTACPHSILKTLKRESNNQLCLALILLFMSTIEETISPKHYTTSYLGCACHGAGVILYYKLQNGDPIATIILLEGHTI